MGRTVATSNDKSIPSSLIKKRQTNFHLPLGALLWSLCDFQCNFHHLGEGVLTLFSGQAFAGKGVVRNGAQAQGVLACAGVFYL